MSVILNTPTIYRLQKYGYIATINVLKLQQQNNKKLYEVGTP